MITREFSTRLNFLRWIAAFAVVISHVRNLLFLDYPLVIHRTFALKIFYFLTGFGHEAVVVFFVISGFLVGGLAAKRHVAGNYDAKEYAIHRFSRIYIVLIPALIAGFALDMIGMTYFNASGLYTHSENFGFERSFALNLDWNAILGNLFLLQYGDIPVLGSNGPLWSLSYEWWYYWLFFLGLGMLSASAGRWTRGLCGGLLLLLAVWLPFEIVLWMTIWMIGVGLAVLPVRRIRIPLWLGYLTFSAALVASRFSHALAGAHGSLPYFLRDLVLALACFILLAAMSNHQRPGQLRRASRVDRANDALAAYSYTSYLAHFPFLIFVVALLYSEFHIPFHRQPSAGGMIYFLLLLPATYLYTWCFSLLTEVHTGKFRRALSAQFAVRTVPKT